MIRPMEESTSGGDKLAQQVDECARTCTSKEMYNFVYRPRFITMCLSDLSTILKLVREVYFRVIRVMIGPLGIWL